MCKEDLINKRVLAVSNHIIETGCTVRAAAKVFGVSKSTVHKDVSERLPEISGILYDKVRFILEKNKCERHLRGGLATKMKYLSIQKDKP